jgi:hypothetical protein
MTTIPSLLAGALLSIAAPALALDRDGLVGGMSVEEALKALGNAGFAATRLPVTPLADVVTFHKKGATGQRGTLMFCDGRLSLYAPPQLQGPLDTLSFLDSLNELTTRFGPGQYSVPASSNGASWLQYRWPKDTEIVVLQLIVAGTSSYKSISYVNPGSCMDRPNPTPSLARPPAVR